MKKAIVTGANGFVGLWLVKELVSNGVEVTAVVRENSNRLECIKDLNGVKIVYNDLSNIRNLSEKIKDCNFDVFYHLAWTGSTGPDRADYALQLKNVKYTVDAVNAASKLKCKKFVGAGTLAEFDCNSYIPLDGATPNSVTCYGTAKLTSHYMSKAECNKLGIEHGWAYLSNTYGIGNRTQNFVNFACKTMITGKSADFTAGEQPYDFVYVSDTARGLYCIGENGKNNFSYYIGSAEPTKLKEFIFKIRDAVDKNIKLNLGAIPFNGIQLPASVFDCTKLVEHTGYKASVSFDEGIKITVDWLRKEIEEERI
ncbi:NAD-dependent epimerase/dehydratase family protein [Clostridium butyricum]|uniref:NAD-dependent epimerase/dehydratase family protein n=1 Tax=Clostridium butyricum TaxID=1492 RepID=UPI002AB2AC01|nr:NAD(P)-dependent oxidoreductase [Clostridium butyricum]